MERNLSKNQTPPKKALLDSISEDTRNYSRREFVQWIGASGALAGLGVPLGAAEPAWARPASHPGEDNSNNLVQNPLGKYGVAPATISGDKIIQPQREIPVLHKTEVLVIGGGPAGVVAAIGASRAGAKVTLMERYGFLGGMWSGGMVLRIMGTHVKAEGGQTKKVIRGIGDELLRRMVAMGGALIERAPGILEPTGDPEAIKVVMDQMVQEAGVQCIYHCWGVDAIMEGNTARGAIFESKSGRQAVLAKVVVDTTGDGDIYAAAGAPYTHHLFAIGLVHRLGNVDRAMEKAKKAGLKPKDLGGPTPIPSVNWINSGIPSVDCLDVNVLTKIEISERAKIWKNVQKLRATPGYEDLFLLNSGPQLGVRISRLLEGEYKLTLKDSLEKKTFKDVVGVGGDNSLAGMPEWQIPYRILVPQKIENVLSAGRCISFDIGAADPVRQIPTCFVTGHAAGVAAAVASRDGVAPRNVDISKVQRVLRDQGAYLG